MTNKTAFVDYWTVAKNFGTGDLVSKWNQIDGSVRGLVGTVTAVHYGIGFVDVEFPWGNERVSAEELVEMDPRNVTTLPLRYNTSYSSWDIDQSHIEEGISKGYSYANPKRAATTSVQDSEEHLATEYINSQSRLEVMAQQCNFGGLNDMDSFLAISSVADVPDHRVRKAVYWAAPGRRYRMNKRELVDGLPDCPKCGANLQKTNYKKHTRLFVCPECLFCIKPSDIEGLPGYVEEGFGVLHEEMAEGQDILTAALKSVSPSVRNAGWDTLRTQVMGLLKHRWKKHEAYFVEVADFVVGNHARDMNIHEGKLLKVQLDREVKDALYDSIRSGLLGNGWGSRQEKGSIGRKIRDAIVDIKNEFNYPDEAIEDIFTYTSELNTEELLDFDDKELARLIRIQKEVDVDRKKRYASGFQNVMACSNPTVLEMREILGSKGMNLLFEEVREGTPSPVLAEQFHHDLEKYGFGDALFHLSASTADGMFDPEAYGRLVDVLDYVRTPMATSALTEME